MTLPRTIKVELTKDELLVCLRGLTSIHEWDPKREIAREAFTKLIRAAQQSSDASLDVSTKDLSEIAA